MGAALKLTPDESFGVFADARRSPRAIAYLCIDLCSEHNFWTGLTMNISEGGVFVATHVMLEPGTLVGLHLELPNRGHRIMTLGEVRWSRAYTGDDDVPPGLGIKFVGLDLGSLAAIRKFMTTIREPILFE
ncbi:MAG: PilZ domain-containing protein [Labilithrix sp.]|nr:PilZ domain-containing protein [Labilithrix sp.]MCW5810951.1 PilZ domain-containing protein [Labilithrix sp.]